MKKLIIATLLPLLLATPALAGTCIETTTKGIELKDPICKFESISSTNSGPFISPNVIVAPTAPAIVEEGVYEVSIIGTPFEGLVSGQYPLDAAYTFSNGVTIPAGVYDVTVTGNGDVRAVAVKKQIDK